MPIITWLLEMIGYNAFKAWWQRDKVQEAKNAANEVDTMSSIELERLRRKWTKPD